MGWFYIVVGVICCAISVLSTCSIKYFPKSSHIRFIAMTIMGYILTVMCIINAIWYFTGRLV